MVSFRKDSLADHLIFHRAAWEDTDVNERDDRRWMQFLRRHMNSVSKLPDCRTQRDAQEAMAEIAEVSGLTAGADDK